MAINEEEKVFFHQDNALLHKSITAMAKLHEFNFKVVLHPPYSPYLAPTNYWLFADLKRKKKGKEIWLQWRSDIRNWGVFWGQSFYNKGIELWEKCWNQCITLEGDYVDV